MLLKDLAKELGAELHGAADIDITSVAGLREAGDGQITYLSDAKRSADLAECRASAIIVPRGVEFKSRPTLAVKNPRYAFALALRLLHVVPEEPSGISDRAVVGKDVIIGEDPSIHPFAVIGNGVRIGNRVTIGSGTAIGKGVIIGDDTVIHANVFIQERVVLGSRVIIHAGAAVGSDGFGFVTEAGAHHKIPQVGGVIIEDDVEIGANSTVDRATLGNTVIKQGTKIDNMVQVAHNVVIGRHCLLASQVGIAGSSILGDYVVLGGQAGVGDHLTLGNRVMAGGGTAITQDVAEGQIVAGHYAMPVREWLKVQAILPKLPELRKLVARMERQLEKQEKNSE